MIRTLLDVDVILELVVDIKILQENGYSCSRDTNDIQSIENLKKIINDDNELAVYIPPALIHKLEYLIKRFTDRDFNKAKRGIDEVLTSIQNKRFQPLDHNNILRKASDIFNRDQYPREADLSDAVSLLCAQELLLEKIITYQPQKFINIISINNTDLSEFFIEICSPSYFIRDIKISQKINVKNEDKIDIIVFSPKKDEIKLCHDTELSDHVTPIDFAYALHDEIGHQCSHAYVNGIEVPLDACLKDGDTVDIRKEGKSPKKEWSEFVGTKRAKSKIENWFRHQNIKKGWKLLSDELNIKPGKNKRISPEELQILQDISSEYKLSIENFIGGEIGSEKQSQEDISRLNEILKKIKLKLEKLNLNIKNGISILEKELGNDFYRNYKYSKNFISIVNKLNYRSSNEFVSTLESKPENINLFKTLWKENNPSFSIARCCDPLPGNEDKIVVVGKSGKRASQIHQFDCQSIKNIQSDYVQSISWNFDHCLASLSIEAYDWPGTFQIILNELAQNNVWVDVRHVTNFSNKTSIINLIIPISSREDLVSIKDKVSSLHGIKNVEWKQINPSLNWWSCDLLEKF